MPEPRKLLPVAATHDQRALLARPHDQPGILGRHRHEGVMTAQAVIRAANGFREIPRLLELTGDQMRHHLDIGLGSERRPRGQQLALSSM
jgi:hypothetical protein